MSIVFNMYQSRAIFKRGNGESGNRGIGKSENWGIGELGNRGIGDSLKGGIFTCKRENL
jgi:hypothetical protein